MKKGRRQNEQETDAMCDSAMKKGGGAIKTKRTSEGEFDGAINPFA